MALAAASLFPTTSPAKQRAVVGPRGLDRRIESILGSSEARRGFWGIEVVRASDGKILYARDPDHLFLPASNMKLFTTAAALEKLGPDFVFRTTVESDARPDPDGRVGDLYLVGRGDPNLSGRVLPYRLKTERGQPADAALESLADQIVSEGIHEVIGNVVADDSYFVFEPYGPNWAEEDVVWGYGAPVTALAFNDNALTLRVQPGTAAGEPARVSTEPVADYYQLKSLVLTAAAGATKHILIERAAGSTELDVWGQIPLGSSDGDGDGEETLAIADPPRLAGELFRRALERRSIAVRGEVRVQHFTPFETAARRDAASGPSSATPPAPRPVLALHGSLPLGEDVKLINKVSQNLHAEMLLRTLGKQVKNEGSRQAGLSVLEDFGDLAGVKKAEIHFADGSGLSREALVAPRAVVKLLEFMARSPRFGTFLDSLPVAAVDGTLAERFHHTAVEGHVHAKTGTLKHVNALSGYMDLPSGERLAFSMSGNNDTLEARGGEEIIDRMCVAVFEWFARHRR